MILAAIVVAGGVFTTPHDETSGGLQIELWQAINLIGAPLLAILFARPVIDDLRAWFATRNDPT